MSQREPHAELADELRQLAQTILDRLDPAVRAAATRAAAAQSGPGRCQQVWCPVCALAALVTGEQHPLLTIVAEHSVTLLSVIRTMTADASGGVGAASPPDPGDDPATAAGANGFHGTNGTNGANGAGYQRIPIVVEPAATDSTGDPATP